MKCKGYNWFGYTLKDCKGKQEMQIWQVKKNVEGEGGRDMGKNDAGGSGHMECNEQNLWESIHNIANSTSTPWIIQCDFNAVLNVQEAVEGNVTDELRSKDCFFTWTNNKDQESRISRKLDRCLVNLTWSEKYALLEFEALPPGLSDHSPLIVSMRKDMKIRNIVQRSWHFEVSGSAMFKLWSKLKDLKQNLRKPNKREFFDIFERVCKYIQMLERVQTRLQEDPLNQIVLDEERAIVNQFWRLLRQEEDFYKQHSRAYWIRISNSNTKYFHNFVKIRNVRTKIMSLKLHDGENFDQGKINAAIVEFYKTLIGSNEFSRQHACTEIIKSRVIVSEEEADELCSIVTNKEIKATIWCIRV
uniref:Endonuclease/exonuclease/phosphatase domain-containing protein n=1 Tax=Manihot esculenta TaxID=3983 RepID=A0A2C9VDX7_MANES